MLARAGRGARAAAGAGLRRHWSCGSSSRCSRRRGAAGAGRATTSGGSSSSPRSSKSFAAGAAGARSARCRRRAGRRRRHVRRISGHRAMIVNQWIPAAHAATRLATTPARCATCSGARDTTPRSYALTIDDDLEREVLPWSDPASRGGDVTMLHFAVPSPMTQALGDAAGHARARATTTSRRRDSSRRTTPASAGWRRSGAGSWRRSPIASTSRSASPNTTGASSSRSDSRGPACCRCSSIPRG